MMDHVPATEDAPLATPASTPEQTRLARIQFGLCLTLTVGMLAYLLWTPTGKHIAAAQASQQEQLSLTPSGKIAIQPDSPLHRKLQVTTVKPSNVTVPLLTVTGTVVASLRQTRGTGKHWQFNSLELLTTYTDWQKAMVDIAFAGKQLEAIRQLADNRVRSQGALVTRLQKLVQAGTDTERDLAAARSELLQAQIQGRKDTHEADTALRLARRTEATLVRQLQQAGLDPDLLRLPAPDIDVVVADVPESLGSRARLGQRCEARFFGVSDKLFSGNVRAISPVLSSKRSLCVLFAIDDPEDLLRPGMFADIGLGTDARAALLVTAAGVVHVGRTDYMLVQDGRAWRVTPVQVGELHGTTVEILDGLRASDRVVGQGAILLKPLVMEALQRQSSPRVGGA